MKIMSVANFILRKLGFQLVKYHADTVWVSQPEGYHLTPKYFGCSAKKQVDIRTLQPFGDLARTVMEDRKTYLNYDRLFTIYQCLNNLPKLDQANLDIAEVGVFKGGGTYFMAGLLEKMGLDDVNIHAVDTFEGHAAVDISSTSDNTKVHNDQKFSETSFEAVKAYLSKFSKVKVYKGRIQDRADEMASTRFAFVHLDMDLYEPTKYGLELFESKMCSGGMILLDDYDCHTCPGVRKAIDEFLENRNTFTRLDLLSAQCVLIHK